MTYMRLMNIFHFTVTRQVAALPPPPRSVVIERFPSLPDKPRKRILFSFLLVLFYYRLLFSAI